MKRCGEHPEIPIDDLDGPSASVAVAVAFHALLHLANKASLMFERVVICAAIGNGNLERVGGECQKIQALCKVPGVRLCILAMEWPKDTPQEKRIELPLRRQTDGRLFFQLRSEPALRVVRCQTLDEVLACIRRVQGCSAVLDR
jgi:hypothetical protein